MALIEKVPTVSVTTRTPPQNEQIPGLRAGEDIGTCDAVYIASNGTVMKTSGAEAVARGVAALQAQAGEPITIYRNVRFGYGSGLTPGTTVRLSTSVDGGLDDAGAGQVVGYVVDDSRIQFTAF